MEKKIQLGRRRGRGRVGINIGTVQSGIPVGGQDVANVTKPSTNRGRGGGTTNIVQRVGAVPVQSGIPVGKPLQITSKTAVSNQK